MATINIDSAEIEYSHDIYEATINTENGRTVLHPTTKNGEQCNRFSTPVTLSNVSKLYIVRNQNESIVYVGKTKQSISSRLRQGLNVNNENGYQGYRWQEKECVKIHCIVINDFNDEQIEATEAELVYVIRNNTGKWPLYQSAIHFSNRYPITKELACSLFKQINN